MSEFPDIKSWLDAQFPRGGGTIKEQVDRVAALKYVLQGEQIRLYEMQLVEARREGALKGITAGPHIQTLQKVPTGEKGPHHRVRRAR